MPPQSDPLVGRQWCRDRGEPLQKKRYLTLSKSTVSLISPMAQWVKLFDEDTDVDEQTADNWETDDSDDSTTLDCDDDDETRAVRKLVQAAFSPGKRTMAIARLIGATVEPTKPGDHLKEILTAAGKPCQYRAASSLENFFEPVTDAYVQGYTLEMVQAVRADDVDTLRRLKDAGLLLRPCGSRSGDSIVHAACRRNGVAAVHFFLRECGWTCRFRNDCGRTPLTDACWTSQHQPSSWKVSWMLLIACPDLLYLTDKHGSAPLDYVPKSHWADWCRFLDHVGADRLQARELHGVSECSSVSGV
jgi:hypothetical protein